MELDGILDLNGRVLYAFYIGLYLLIKIYYTLRGKGAARRPRRCDGPPAAAASYTRLQHTFAKLYLCIQYTIHICVYIP